MPLRASCDGETLLAPLLDDAAWRQLRDRSRVDRDALLMGCCCHQAVAKVSKLGTRYFAHRPGADCAVADGETVHHLHLKSALIAQLTALGFDADAEVACAGWRADVLAADGLERVAFEVQWSAQTPERTLDRSRRYAESGVRVVWLMRQRIHPELAERSDVMCVRVSNPAPGEYPVTLGGRQVSVERFVSLWAAGEVHLSRRTLAPLPDLRAYQAAVACAACGELTPAVAVSPSPARSTCGLAEREDNSVVRAACEALADAIREGRVRAPSVIPHPEPGKPARQICQACGTVLNEAWARRGVHAALRDRREAELLLVWTPTVAGKPRHQRHWCASPDAGGCEPETLPMPKLPGGNRVWDGFDDDHRSDQPAPEAQAIAEMVADEFNAVGEPATVRSPSGSAGASRTDVALVDLPGRRTAVLCSPRMLRDCELTVWQARLSGSRKLLVLSGAADQNRDEQSPAGVARLFVGHPGNWWVQDGQQPRPIQEWLATMLGIGTKVQRYLPARQQTVRITVVNVACWHCGHDYTAVDASGTWLTRCGRREAEMSLWDTGVGWRVAAALKRGELPVTGIVEWRYSSVMQESGWANICPRCRRFYGQHFLDREYYDDETRVLELIMDINELPRTRHPWWEGEHVCAHGCNDPLIATEVPESG